MSSFLVIYWKIHKPNSFIHVEREKKAPIDSIIYWHTGAKAPNFPSTSPRKGCYEILAAAQAFSSQPFSSLEYAAHSQEGWSYEIEIKTCF